jgi:hypothetical protein
LEVKEIDIQTRLGNYFNGVAPPYSITYELKLVKTKSFAFSRLPQHQIDNLLASLNGLHHKISDSPIYQGMKTRFTNPKPFDAIWIKADYAYVILCFYQPRTLKRCFFIPIEDYVQMVKFHKRKSIRMDELGFEYVDI